MEHQGAGESVAIGFIVTLGLLALLSFLFFIPLLGLLFLFVLSPYMAGFAGAKYVSGRNGVWVAGSAAFFWSLSLAFVLPPVFTMPMNMDVSWGMLEIFVISLLLASNVFFCILGARARGESGSPKAITGAWDENHY